MNKSKTEKIYQKVNKWLTKRGFQNIKANVEGYETPTGFQQRGADDLVIPDITASTQDSKYYFEIAVKPSQKTKIQQLVSKWKLLSLLANNKGGKLYLMAPYGNKSFAQRIIERYKIDAKFIFLPELKG
jgi:Holliday junction resolvase